MNNHDEAILRGRRIDRRAPFPVLHQALRIALYNAYAARSFYARVIEAFGPRPPFADLVKAEEQEVTALSALCQRFGIPRPLDAFPSQTRPASGWLANCQRGLAGEVASLRLYGELLGAVREPETRRLFLQLQTDALEHHLPALQHAALEAAARERFHAARGIGPEQAYVRHGPLSDFVEKALAHLGAHAGPIGFVGPILRHTHPATLAGLAVGGAGVYLVKTRLRRSQKEN